MTVNSRDGISPAGQGVPLFWRVWEAPEPVRVLMLVHGLGEHSGRYDAFAQAVAAAGTSVFSFDLRGHGHSPGPRGDVDAFPRFLEDLLAMEEEMGRQLPVDGPRVLMGHSLGGLICIRRLQVFRGPYAGSVISAPWMATNVPEWLKKVGKAMGIVLPDIPLPAGIDPGRLTRDPDMIQAIRSDGLIHRRITGRLFKEAAREQVTAFTSGWPRDLPGLFLIPTDDRVVVSGVSATYAQGIVGAPVQVEILEGRRHEPLNDMGREEVYRIVLNWLDELLRGGGAENSPDPGDR